jgi:deoxyribose-phosphate aldolase
VGANFNLEDRKSIAALIDHTLLKPEAAESDIISLCSEADEYRFATVCVNPFWVPLCAAQLSGSGVGICTVIGFPLGANTSDTKVAEARQALANGARELDVVQNVGALRSNAVGTVHEEIESIVSLAREGGAVVKVILETSLLTEEQIIESCQIAARAGADFVKTSTGFGGGGATLANVRLMRETVGPSVGVKASGGVRTLNALREMTAAGANRIGTSSGIAILNGINSGAAAY